MLTLRISDYEHLLCVEKGRDFRWRSRWCSE